jgi:hypothetical protein
MVLWDVEAPTFSRTVGSQMAVRSALCAGRPLPPGRSLVLISVKRPSRLQGHSGAGRIRSIEKNPMTSSGIEPATFRLVALCPTNYATACPRSVYNNWWDFQLNSMRGLHCCCINRLYVTNLQRIVLPPWWFISVRCCCLSHNVDPVVNGELERIWKKP